jgi:hypothetical protein
LYQQWLSHCMKKTSESQVPWACLSSPPLLTFTYIWFLIFLAICYLVTL